MICQHFNDDGQGGCNCSLTKRNGSMGVCAICRHNPAKGIWPTISAVAGGANPPPPPPIARDRWPKVANVIARWATASDRGLGDIVERLLAKGGAKAFKLVYKRVTGTDCGCSDRRDRLNAMFPLPGPPPLAGE